MTITFVPLHFNNSTLLARILADVERLFSASVKTAQLPIETKRAYSADRNQYYSTVLLAEAIKKTDGIDGKVALLVDFDLYVPVFTYLFGEAQLRGKHAIISVCRLHEEFYSENSNDELLYERTLKEVLHELGHTFGLIHCKDWGCAMHSSVSVEEIDIKPGRYCKSCAQQVEGYRYFTVETDY